MICNYCSQVLEDTAATCFTCGASVTKHASPSALSTPGTTASNATDQRIHYTNLQNANETLTPKKREIIDLKSGSHLGKFEIVSKLGEGGIGAVFKVRGLDLNRKELALKVVRSLDADTLNNILLEFESRNKIKNFQNILTGYNPERVNDGLSDYIIYPMELADSSFRDWLTTTQGDLSGRFTAGLELFVEACEGVREIHEKELIHLDLKPENILLLKREGARNYTDIKWISKVTDFGLTRGVGLNALQSLHDGAGTPAYMAPEQIKAANWAEIGGQADIYALGVILYELITGKVPFSGSPKQIKDKKIQGVKPALIEGEKAELGKVIGKCLETDPALRYASVEELLADIRRAMLGLMVAADVSCHKCRHINHNPNARSCEKCSASIDYLFDTCAKCEKEIRLDVEKCPVCGYNQQYERLFNLRSEKLKTLQHESPSEAIELLEKMMQDRHKITNDHFELIKELRRKHREAVQIIEEAKKFQAAGKLGEAIATYKKVFTIFSRHKAAMKSIEHLEILLKKSKKAYADAALLMDEGRFAECILMLQQAITELADDTALPIILNSALEREAKFLEAVEKGKAARQRNDYGNAIRNFETALSFALKNKEVRKEYDATKNLADKLLQDLLQKIEKFSVSDPVELVKTYEAIIQLGYLVTAAYTNGLSEAKKYARKFTDNLEKARQFENRLEFDGAIKQYENLLDDFPENSEVQAAIRRIKSMKSDFAGFESQFHVMLLKGDFTGCTALAESARKRFPDKKRIDELQAKKEGVETRYNKEMAQIKDEVKTGKLKSALSMIAGLLQLVPDSATLKNLKADTEKLATANLNAKREALNYVIEADAEKAVEILTSIFEDGIGTTQRDSELLTEMRRKSERVSALVVQTKALPIQKKPSDIAALWKQVLDILPKHENARKQYDKLKKSIDDFQQFKIRVKKLVKAGDFEKVESQLKLGEFEFAMNEDFIGFQTEIQAAKDKVSTLLKRAITDLKGKMLQSALLAYTEVLETCPDNADYYSEKTKVQNLIEETLKLQKELFDAVKLGDFSLAEEKKNKLFKLRQDIPDSDNKKIRKALDSESDYRSALTGAQNLFSGSHYDQALSEVTKALKIAPKSVEAVELSRKIKAAIEKRENDWYQQQRRLAEETERRRTEAEIRRGYLALGGLITAGIIGIAGLFFLVAFIYHSIVIGSLESDLEDAVAIFSQIDNEQAPVEAVNTLVGIRNEVAYSDPVIMSQSYATLLQKVDANLLQLPVHYLNYLKARDDKTMELFYSPPLPEGAITYSELEQILSASIAQVKAIPQFMSFCDATLTQIGLDNKEAKGLNELKGFADTLLARSSVMIRVADVICPYEVALSNSMKGVVASLEKINTKLKNGTRSSNAILQWKGVNNQLTQIVVRYDQSLRLLKAEGEKEYAGALSKGVKAALGDISVTITDHINSVQRLQAQGSALMRSRKSLNEAFVLNAESVLNPYKGKEQMFSVITLAEKKAMLSSMLNEIASLSAKFE